MAKKSLLTVDGIRRQVKKQFLTIDGTYRKIKKAFITRDGVYRPFYAAEPFGGYTGDYTVQTVTVDGAECDLYTLTSSGTLTLNDSAEYWMCGGGNSGGPALCFKNLLVAGGGGGGGHSSTGALKSGTHVVTIGAAAGNTSITASDAETINANCGSFQYYGDGGSGGSGGAAGYAYTATGEDEFNLVLGDLHDGRERNAGVGDHVSTYPFGLTELGAHCAGGNSGCFYFSDADAIVTRFESWYGGSNGSDGTNNKAESTSAGSNGIGAEKGGGIGGRVLANSTKWFRWEPSAATFYGGGGGGRGLGYHRSMGLDSESHKVTGGAGYQGVCYILIPR